MVKAFRLPPAVPEDELRMTFESPCPAVGAKNDLIVSAGNRGLQRALLAAFGEKRVSVDLMALSGVVGFGNTDRFLQSDPPLIDAIESAGYDPETLVVSIRRKTDAPPPPLSADDARGLIEKAQEQAAAALEDMEAWSEAHDVSILSSSDKESLQERLEQIRDLLGEILDPDRNIAPDD